MSAQTIAEIRRTTEQLIATMHRSLRIIEDAEVNGRFPGGYQWPQRLRDILPLIRGQRSARRVGVQWAPHVLCGLPRYHPRRSGSPT